MPTYVRSLESLKKLNEDDFERLYNTIKEQFFEGKPINAKKIRKAIEALTHIFFELPILVMIEDLVKRTTVSNYVCRFSFVGNEESIFDLIQKRHVSGKDKIFKIHNRKIFHFEQFFEKISILFRRIISEKYCRTFIARESIGSVGYESLDLNKCIFFSSSFFKLYLYFCFVRIILFFSRIIRLYLYTYFFTMYYLYFNRSSSHGWRAIFDIFTEI